jgi:hypothetical protein
MGILYSKMKRSIRCLRYRDNKKYERQSQRSISSFKKKLQYRIKKFNKPEWWKALDLQSKTVCNVRMRVNGNLQPTFLEYIWMIREGKALYKAIEEHYGENC